MIEFIEKEEVWQNETTKYWFDVDGEKYCVADKGGDLSLLDSEGYPIEDCNDHDNIKDLLLPEYEKYIND